MNVRKRGDWLIARVGGECIMMSRQKVHHIGMTEVGARIWELLDEATEVDAVCAQLRNEYAIPPDVCRSEVEAFLNELAGHGAVAIEGAEAARP